MHTHINICLQIPIYVAPAKLFHCRQQLKLLAKKVLTAGSTHTHMHTYIHTITHRHHHIITANNGTNVANWKILQQTNLSFTVFRDEVNQVSQYVRRMTDYMYNMWATTTHAYTRFSFERTCVRYGPCVKIELLANRYNIAVGAVTAFCVNGTLHWHSPWHSLGC